MDEFFRQKSEEISSYRFTDPTRAYHVSCEILQHGIEHTDNYETAYAYLYMGDTLFSLGRVEEALRKIHLGEQIQKQYGFDELLMKTYNTMGVIYMAQGDGLLALDYYYSALELAEKHKNYGMISIVYNNIGVVLTDFGDPSGAADYFEKSGQISREGGEGSKKIWDNERQICVNICERYIVEGRYQEAKEYLDHVMIKTAKNHRYSAVTEMSVISAYVRIYYNLGKSEMAYQEAMKVFDLPKDCFDELDCLRDFMHIVKLLIKMDRLDEAKDILLNLEQEWNKSGIIKCRLELCMAWITFYKATGEKEALREIYHRYYELRQSQKKEADQAVIEAIDNRSRLEYQKVLNEQLKADNMELAAKSETDELTGINNRYGLNRKFESLKKMASFEDVRICVGIFDIDYYKIYNDTYGHIQGDICLKKIAQILKETAGDEYITARYGGDEFVVLGMDKTDTETEAFIKKLFSNISQENIAFKEHPTADRVTISMGAVNVKPDHENEIVDVIHNADKMLYQAKRNGKNQYVIPFSC